jgi:hypothetical protein
MDISVELLASGEAIATFVAGIFAILGLAAILSFLTRNEGS